MEHFTMDVTGQDPDSIQDNLTAAVNTAHALDAGQGIMITQHDLDHFTVSLSPDVPYGQTREHRAFDTPRTRVRTT